MAQVIEPDFDDNAYYNYLPPHLRDRYKDSLDDPELTHLRRQIALMDVRIKILLENLDRQILQKSQIVDDLQEKFPHLSAADISDMADYTLSLLPETYIDHRTFKRLEGLIDRHEKAQLDGRIRDADRARKQLFESIRAGRRDGDVWEDIQNVMEQRRRLGEAEERRLSHNQEYLRLEQVVIVVRAIVSAFKDSTVKYVTDREIQQYILAEADRTYQKLLGVTTDRLADQ